MIPSPDGGLFLYTTKRPLQRPVILVFIAVSFILAACSGVLSSGGWPGATVHDNIVYIAAGAQVYALDIAAEEVVWTFPPEDAGNRSSFFAAPSLSRQLRPRCAFWLREDFPESDSLRCNSVRGA